MTTYIDAQRGAGSLDALYLGHLAEADSAPRGWAHDLVLDADQLGRPLLDGEPHPVAPLAPRAVVVGDGGEAE